MKKTKIGWNAYTGVLDAENPYSMWGDFYDSPLDMETKRAVAFQKLGDAFSALWMAPI
jgi:hypothetical protein